MQYKKEIFEVIHTKMDARSLSNMGMYVTIVNISDKQVQENMMEMGLCNMHGVLCILDRSFTSAQIENYMANMHARFIAADGSELKGSGVKISRIAKFTVLHGTTFTKISIEFIQPYFRGYVMTVSGQHMSSALGCEVTLIAYPLVGKKMLISDSF